MRRIQPVAKLLGKFGQILVLMLILLIGATVVNLIPAIYSIIIDYYELPSLTYIMLEEAVFILIGAIISLVWGYSIDKLHHKRILLFTLILFLTGLLICTLSTQFTNFFIGRVITALGYGAFIPIIYSLLSDYIPAKYWSTIFGILAFINSLGNVTGNFLSGFISPLNIWNLHWKFSFVILSVVTLILGTILIFFRFPHRGASSVEVVNKELGEMLREGNLAYPFRIKRRDLRKLWKIKTNRRLIILSFFAVIPGSIMSSFLIYYMSTYPFVSFPQEIRIQISQIFAGAVGTGYFVGTFTLGPVFDLLHRRSPRLRAYYTFIGLLIAIPMIIFAFLLIVPVNYEKLNLDPALLDNTINPNLYFELVTSIFFYYPTYTFYVFMMFVGSFLISGITINRTPTLLEVNVPEHMGTSQAMLHFSDQFGKGFTYLFIAFQYYIYEFLFSVVNGLIILITSILFYIVPLLLWKNISKDIEEESHRAAEIIRDRSLKEPGEISSRTYTICQELEEELSQSETNFKEDG
ncbi:MAG: hypothetical protein DRO88_09025 [Promethearchaeia archaeon]|nr:MAG: hypothetical protein DRO88_09025 [Candidatus Lokiarchaeia archaeon]